MVLHWFVTTKPLLPLLQKALNDRRTIIGFRCFRQQTARDTSKSPVHLALHLLYLMMEVAIFKDVKNLTMDSVVINSEVNHGRTTKNVNSYTNYGQHASNGGRIDNYNEERRAFSAQTIPRPSVMQETERYDTVVLSFPEIWDAELAKGSRAHLQ